MEKRGVGNFRRKRERERERESVRVRREGGKEREKALPLFLSLFSKGMNI
jgi:hypothetical protein